MSEEYSMLGTIYYDDSITATPSLEYCPSSILSTISDFDPSVWDTNTWSESIKYTTELGTTDWGLPTYDYPINCPEIIINLDGASDGKSKSVKPTEDKDFEESEEMKEFFDDMKNNV